MAENNAPRNDYSVDSNTQIRDMEEKQRLLKERVLLIGQSLIEEREKFSKDIREMKRDISILKEENERIKGLLQRMAEQIGNLARKEEISILQRQLDLFRKE